MTTKLERAKRRLVADCVNEHAAELIRAAAHCDAAGDFGAQVAVETILGHLQSWMEAEERLSHATP